MFISVKDYEYVREAFDRLYLLQVRVYSKIISFDCFNWHLSSRCTKEPTMENSIKVEISGKRVKFYRCSLNAEKNPIEVLDMELDRIYAPWVIEINHKG